MDFWRNHSEMWQEDEQLRAQTVFKQFEEYLFILLYVFSLGHVCVWTMKLLPGLL